MTLRAVFPDERRHAFFEGNLGLGLECFVIGVTLEGLREALWNDGGE